MSPLLIHILRVLHILAASFWTGGALVNTAFLAPAVRASGPAGGQVMRNLVQKGLPLFMNTSAGIALATGIALYWWRSSGFQGGWAGTPAGITFGAGGITGIMAGIIGFFFIGRIVARIGPLAARLAAGEATADQAAELQRLQARMSLASRTATVLLVSATALMAVARYL